MPQGLSDREASKRCGVSHPGIGKARLRGSIRVFSDGSIDPAGLDEWMVNRQSGHRGNQKVETAKVSAIAETVRLTAKTKAEAENTEAALTALATEGVFETLAEAVLTEKSYQARLREIEYERERGALIEADKVAAAVEADYAQVRTKLLALPAEQAPRLHRCKTVTEIQDALHGLLVEALEALSRGAAANRLG